MESDPATETNRRAKLKGARLAFVRQGRSEAEGTVSRDLQCLIWLIACVAAVVTIVMIAAYWLELIQAFWI